MDEFTDRLMVLMGMGDKDNGADGDSTKGDSTKGDIAVTEEQ